MIKKFESGKWYRLLPEGVSHVYWNNVGDMDFLRDFKPHRCKEGNGYYASFYDSGSYMWDFGGALSLFVEGRERQSWKEKMKDGNRI